MSTPDPYATPQQPGQPGQPGQPAQPGPVPPGYQPPPADQSWSAAPPPPGAYQTPGAPPPGQPTPMQKFYAWIRRLGIIRPGNRVFGGVAAGLALRSGIDPWIVRLVLFLLIAVGGLSLWFYIAAWILLPDGRTGTIPLERWGGNGA